METTATEAMQIHLEADCLVTPEKLSNALDNMACDITARLENRAPLVVAVLNGGLIPASELLLRLHFPLEVDYLHATRYGHETQGDKLKWLAYPQTATQGRSVLVIDDIFDQGHTLAAIVEHLRIKGAKEVLTAVVVNKLHDRKVDFTPDFVGVDVEDRFLYGFGMDYKGYFRNANGIYAVKGL